LQTAADIRLCAEKVRQEISGHYHDLDMPMSPQASDVVELIESLASVLSPLYEDIHATFAAASTTVRTETQFAQDAAQS
jgi:multidrug resistance protein MdtO